MTVHERACLVGDVVKEIATTMCGKSSIRCRCLSEFHGFTPIEDTI
jgi:hypothetical protein